MKGSLLIFLLCLCIPFDCDGFRILAIFPYNGRSHHILFLSLVEELAMRDHEVTVINYLPVKTMPNLRQISIQDESGGICNIDIDENLKSIPASPLIDFYRAYDMAVAFKAMADDNCERLMTHADIRQMLTSGKKYDLIIVEQFVTDCGLAIAFKLNAPVVGITAHMLMPWTHSRLGAPDSAVFVPNHLFASGSKPGIWKKIQSAIINLGMNAYYRNLIQKSNQQIVNKFYPDVPDLEMLGKNISLVLLNQYFPLSGSRLHGANIVEVGGLHIKQSDIYGDEELQNFLNSAETGVVYISFGTVAKHFPSNILEEIMAFIKNTEMKFVWKVDNFTDTIPRNLLMRKWLPQPAILCHQKVVAFVSHSGMLSTTEAIHCGVPVIAVPLFGDQFSNAAAAFENGLGVVLDIYTLDRSILADALQAVLQDKFQTKAKQLSKIWKDRPLPAMDTAVFWIEYVARNQGSVDMRPSTVHLNSFEYYMLDILLVSSFIIVLCIFIIVYFINKLYRLAMNLRQDKIQKVD